jgi:hypothetical protein
MTFLESPNDIHWGQSFPFRKLAAGYWMEWTTKPTMTTKPGMNTDDTKNRKLANTALATFLTVAGGLIDTYGEKGVRQIKEWIEKQAQGARNRAMTQEAEIRNVTDL